MVRDVYLQIWVIQNNIEYSQRDVLKIQYAQVHYQKGECLNGPPKVPAGTALPGDVAPPPPGPLHLRLLHAGLRRGRRLHLLGRGHRPALWHDLLLGRADHGHLALADEVDLAGGRHPLRLPLPRPVVLVHRLVGARVKGSASHLRLELPAHLDWLLVTAERREQAGSLYHQRTWCTEQQYN